MRTNTASGRQSEAEFSVFPVLTPDAEANLEVELRRKQGPGTLCLSAGFGVRIDDGEVCIARHESDAVGRASKGNGPGTTCSELDAREWHVYRLERSPDGCRLIVDGKTILQSDDPGLRGQVVRFGSGGDLEAESQPASARIANSAGYSINWSWDANHGFPDQFPVAARNRVPPDRR